MRSFLCFFFCWTLTACDSPSPAFQGAVASRHDIDGNTYSVYVKGNRAQAIRTNFARRPDIRLIADQAEMAIETASGCPVTQIYGDVALLTGVLDCARPILPNEPAKFIKPPRRGLTCMGDSMTSQWGGWRNVTLDCY